MNNTYETKRGSLEDEYRIYVECMQGLGEYIKTFDEWLES